LSRRKKSLKSIVKTMLDLLLEYKYPVIYGDSVRISMFNNLFILWFGSIA